MMERKRNSSETQETGKKERQAPKTSEYGTQLREKQKVKQMYGMRERQFKRFFSHALRSKGAPGDALLQMLERRLDNVVYRLKLAMSREQARQIITHGHILVNNKKVSSPAFLVSIDDVITVAPRVLDKKVFLENVVDKRLHIGIKVPEWLELDKDARLGRVIRLPVRTDIQVPIEEHLIVELYSK